MSDEQIQAELADEEKIQAEPVFDEWTLARLAEAAEAEDHRIRAVTALKELHAEAEDRDRVQADALRRSPSSTSPRNAGGSGCDARHP
jgi:hypothetical protein